MNELSAIFIGPQPPRSIFFGASEYDSVLIENENTASMFYGNPESLAIFVGNSAQTSTFIGKNSSVSVFTFQDGVRSIFSNLGQLTITGKLTQSSVTLNSSVNDYPFAFTNIIRLTASGAYIEITGIANGAAFDEILTLYNIGTIPIVLPNQSLSSLAENRFQFTANQPITLLSNQSIKLWYDTSSSFWRSY